MKILRFSRLKLIISILILIGSVIFFINESIECPTGINCSPILPGQWPFVILGVVSLIYLILIIIPRK